ncbi:putative movement protein [Grapevine polerovirus 1]|nr:putative movement protein [Grapevine polerovirus 1]
MPGEEGIAAGDALAILRSKEFWSFQLPRAAPEDLGEDGEQEDYLEQGEDQEAKEMWRLSASSLIQSKRMTPGSSDSALVYHSAQLYRRECSRPTINIRSLHSLSATSLSRPAPLKEQLHLRSTPVARSLPSLQDSLDSESQKRDPQPGCFPLRCWGE